MTRKKYTILDYINFWTKQSCKDDKGGTFSLDLYVKYLRVKNNQK